MNDFRENDQEGLRLTEQLRAAVRSQPVPPYLEARIRSAIRAAERRPAWGRRLVPAVAALAVCLVVAITYELGYLRLTTSSQESYIASVSARVATLMRVGLGDHIHCSVFRKYPKNPPSADQIAEKLGTEYKDLIPILKRQAPADCRLVIAHTCRYHGRKFVHLSLKSNTRLLSLIITRKNEGESFEVEGLLPSMVRSGISFHRAGVQRFEIASFETRDHLVYFVSDLGRQQNMEVMLAIAPQVKQLLEALES